MNSAVPRTTSSMPSVTRNDVIFSRVTNQPLTSPITAAIANAATKATFSEVAPLLNSVHISTGEKPNTEPTDRSNSPERHQQRHRQRDQPQLDREGQRVADVLRRQEIGIERAEDDDLDQQQDERPHLRPRDQPLHQRSLVHVGLSLHWRNAGAAAPAAAPAHPTCRAGSCRRSARVSFSYSAPVMTLNPGGMPLAAIAASDSAT